MRELLQRMLAAGERTIEVSGGVWDVATLLTGVRPEGWTRQHDAYRTEHPF